MRIYLDHNATAPLRPEARAAMDAALAAGGNAHSVHAEGRRARAVIENSRAQVAALAGVKASSVHFTAGGTQANAEILLHAARKAGVGRVIVSAVEHESVLALAPVLESQGLPATVCEVTGDGVLDLDALSRHLRETRGRTLVSVMAANNVTGVVQPVGEAAALTRKAGGLFHCDAVQAAGKIVLDASLCDYTTLSAHKLGGPQGMGAIVLGPDARFERDLPVGTENTAAVAGFGAAAQAARDGLSSMPGLSNLRVRFEQALMESWPETIIVGAGAGRLAQTVCAASLRVPSETMVIALDLEGFAVSAGSACASGRVARSHVLSAMRAKDAVAASAVRVSFGADTPEEHLMELAAHWGRIARRAASLAA